MTNKTEKITLGHEIIRAAMKQRDLDFSELAEAINEKRPDKVSLAVRCTTGNHRRSIEIRKKVAQALDLDPAQVWDEVYLKESQNKSKVATTLSSLRTRSPKESGKQCRLRRVFVPLPLKRILLLKKSVKNLA